MLKVEEYIGNEIGGIAVADLVPADLHPVVGKSGRVLNIAISSDKFFIKAMDDSQHFKARVYRNGLDLYINNSGIYGDRHPDLFPGQLLQTAFTLFDALHPVESIRGNWCPTYGGRPSSNYQQFEEYLKRLGKVVFTKDDRIAAAKSTWTGRSVAKLGYTEVSRIGGTRRAIKVNFVKPKF